MKALAKTIREVKQTSDLAISIVRIEQPVLAAWTDSTLYGAEGEVIDND